MGEWLRGDFHMHTHHSFDCLVSPQALVRRAQAVGLTCIAVTDHNELAGALEVAAIAPFKVIPGEEVMSTAGEITGLFLSERVAPGMGPVETARAIKAQGALVSIPHPFTGYGRSALDRATAEDVLPYVDIVEAFNARTMKGADNTAAAEFARAHHLPVTAVSDAHTTGELGRTYTEFPDFDGTPAGFLAALAEARLVCRPAGVTVHLWSTLNKLVRRFKRVP